MVLLLLLPSMQHTQPHSPPPWAAVRTKPMQGSVIADLVTKTQQMQSRQYRGEKGSKLSFFHQENLETEILTKDDGFYWA